MDKELAIRNEVELTPGEVVEGATTQAKLLMDIVGKTHCYQEISGKKYLQVEAWETIGAFNRTHAETESITPITKGEDVIGYQAHAQLWKDGVIVGGAIMPCYFTENCCKGKEGDAKHKASMSAAQTFAISKAYRMNFSYVAILAGYQPLPAEEITEDMTKPVDKTEHWCQEHNTAFFKRGRMKSYAHPIEGSEDADGKKIWCHEHTEKETPPTEPTEEIFPDETPPDASTAEKTTPDEGTAPNATDELLSKVAEAKGYKNYKTARSYLVNSLKIEDSRINTEPATVWEEIKEYFS